MVEIQELLNKLSEKSGKTSEELQTLMDAKIEELFRSRIIFKE